MDHYKKQPPGSRRPRRGKDGAAVPQTGLPEGADEVLETRRLLELARQIVDATPEVRPEKVAALQKALKEGTYQVDSRKLANIILAKILSGME